MALQHIALLWLIFNGTKDGSPVTTAKLVQQTRVHATTLTNMAVRLEKLGLVTRKKVTASHGKGRAWEYWPALPPDLTQIAFEQDQSRLFGAGRQGYAS
jgi:predicted transcriptional regulator